MGEDGRTGLHRHHFSGRKWRSGPRHGRSDFADGGGWACAAARTTFFDGGAGRRVDLRGRERRASEEVSRTDLQRRGSSDDGVSRSRCKLGPEYADDDGSERKVDRGEAVRYGRRGRGPHCGGGEKRRVRGEREGAGAKNRADEGPRYDAKDLRGDIQRHARGKNR